MNRNDFITGEYLESVGFGKELEGSYSDRWEFSILPITDKKGNIIKWSFCIFNEVNGRLTRVRYIETIGQLHNIYEAITDKEL